MAKRALIVVTNCEKYATTDKPTGLWLGECTHFCEVLDEHKVEYDLVSPQGGYVPIEPNSIVSGMTPADWKFYADPAFRKQLGNSLKPSQVDPSKYNIIFYTGGHGVVFDFPDNKEIQNLATHIYEHGGVVAAVCHGPAGILNIKLSNGEYLIKGKKVNGFSNEEECAVKLEKYVPYMLEDELVKRGGHYQRGEAWKAYAVTDERLVTGQNPASAAEVARQTLKVLGHK